MRLSIYVACMIAANLLDRTAKLIKMLNNKSFLIINFYSNIFNLKYNYELFIKYCSNRFKTIILKFFWTLKYRVVEIKILV